MPFFVSALIAFFLQTSDTALHDEVAKRLSALAATNQAADTDRFITCLHLIQEHCPEFADRSLAFVCIFNKLFHLILLFVVLGLSVKCCFCCGMFMEISRQNV